MSNKVIRQESAGTLLGVDGRYHNVIANNERILNQQFTSHWKEYTQNGMKYRIKFIARFDDNCGNGHETFSLTGEIQRKSRGRWVEDSFGCIHDDIKKMFPKVSSLIKWHLCSTDGPMHYIQNTVYLAGDRDCWGLRKGEPSQNPIYQKHFVKFGDSPIEHFVSDNLYIFILSNPTEYILDKVDHPRNPEVYGSKYQFVGMECKWYECPFDSETICRQWLDAITTCNMEWVTRTTEFGEGKERELDKARKAAIWLDAPDDVLMSDRIVLENVLRDRLPGLVEEFRQTMLSAGFSV